MKHFRWRLRLKFISQYSVMLFIVTLLVCVGFLFLGFYLEESDIRTDFQREGLRSLGEGVYMPLIDEDPELTHEIKNETEDRNGWIQLINEQGTVIDSYQSDEIDEELKSTYTLQELTAYQEGENAPPYELSTYLITYKDGPSYYLLYGEHSQTAPLMELVLANGLNSDLKKTFESVDAWAYVFEGREVVGSLNAPSKETPTLGTVVEHVRYPDRFGANVQVDEGEDGLTYVVYTPTQREVGMDEFQQRVWIAFVGLISIVAVALIFASFWFSRTFAKPVQTIVNSLDQLSKGKYETVHADKMGLKKNGKYRKPYKLYRELNDSLLLLSMRLNEAEEKRRNLKRAGRLLMGVSHDMKTPLSTIQGYAFLLADSSYIWTNAELHDIGSALKERSEFMSALIDDLSLTYRLDNGSLPITKEKVQVGTELKSIARLMGQQMNGGSISIDCTEQLWLNADPRWFKRILENLIKNAFVHNGPGTNVGIRADMKEQLLSIVIEDDGNGMDEETKHHLFDRYYQAPLKHPAVDLG
ncbi:HAMP domain-containing sensor histidine kinase [Bacillus sp. JCM 19041]|uniref:HAMP domain-containing sensor histidine kinase n=1 Tax=Bacillus sp. JCM 19041 TaxID=1460637 RepID=UPI0009E8CAEE